VRAIVENRLGEGRKLIAQIVAAGQERGEIDRRLNEEKVALHLQESLLGTIVMWSLKGEPGFEAWVEESFQHFWGAIATRNQKQES